MVSGTDPCFEDPRWSRGIELFNAAEFFDAHEVVEELWQETADPARGFLKGFIQAAVALEHHRRGNPRGLASVGDTAVVHLRRADPRSGGIDVTGLAADLEAFRARLASGAAGDADPPWPVVRTVEADGSSKEAS